METRKAIRKRRTIRSFLKKDVPIKMIFEVLDCGRWAPTYHGAQSWEFVIVKEEEKRKKLAEAAGSPWASTAPYMIVVCVNLDRARFYIKEKAEKFALMECSAAIQNILLGARDLGLGSAWISDFDAEEVRNLIKSPEDVVPIAIIPIGYPAEFPEGDRAPLEFFVHIEEFANPWPGKIEKEYRKKGLGANIIDLLS